MVTISLCMIVKNEEDVLDRCLKSVGVIPDEIIIVDTGSTDKTKEIASKHTDKIYDFEWVYDFAAARNFSFSKATMDYILWLDADDIFTDQDRGEFLKLKETLDPQVDVVMMKYHTAFDQEGRPTFTYYRERLVRNSPLSKWAGAVHEVITPYGKIHHADIAVTHSKIHPAEAGRNLKIYEKQLELRKELEPRQQYYYARELYYNGEYQKSADTFISFLDGKKGWIEDSIAACKMLAQCFYALKQPELALPALFRSLEWDVPRAEVCCDIGSYFLDRNQIKQATFWFEQAAAIEPDPDCHGFISPECYDFIPYLQLCVCYDRLGDLEKAKYYNEKAAGIKPGDPAVAHNRTYLEKAFHSLKDKK